ncbi:MAG: hypothetical protein GF409_05505 [Candidatus Omnitrophica bacterium]|nr:hypothetical protein [Candidatus Omnitrophota bacterium]
MISKQRLLAGLHELIYVEEGMVTVFTNFTKVLVGETEGIEDEKRRKIDSLISQLHRDSSRHREMVEELLLKIEKDSRDEY